MLTPTPSVSVPQMTFSRPCLGELLDQQPVLRQQPGVVHADAVADEAAQLLAEGRVEAEVADRRGDRFALLARGQLMLVRVCASSGRRAG